MVGDLIKSIYDVLQVSHGIVARPQVVLTGQGNVPYEVSVSVGLGSRSGRGLGPEAPTLDGRLVSLRRFRTSTFDPGPGEGVVDGS